MKLDKNLELILELEAAPDDPHVSSPDFQQGLTEVSTALRDGGVAYSQRRMMFDSVGAQGYALGQYFIPLAQIAGSIIGGALVAWVTGRAGRKLKIKVGEVELEANTAAEIDNLMAKAFEMKAQLTSANTTHDPDR